MSRVIDAAAPFSISKIYYSTEHHCWIHHGFGYGRDAKRVREWKVRSIHFDPREKEWFFNGNWWDHGSVGENMETGRQHGARDQIHSSLCPAKPATA
ncbi:hypothetical protein [Sphingomonas aerophila]|uniref:Uncharacterized protein n=1 Tax=Sphingomonas aerophila TaxID=1344948 RepID=A0A7W9BGU0_9SPHN|nr:hypothetical protein [Sphingomonas aerophila]MBB5716882.1 hypothetical protein [Sphingomonas aerophila]